MIEQLDAVYVPNLIVDSTTESSSVGWHFRNSEQSAAAHADLSHLPSHQGVDPVAPLRKLQMELREILSWEDDFPKPNAVALWLADQVLEFAADAEILPTRLRPSPDGGVILAFRKGDLYAKIEVFNDGEVYVALSGYEGTPRVWPVTGEGRIRKALVDIRDYLG